MEIHYQVIVVGVFDSGAPKHPTQVRPLDYDLLSLGNKNARFRLESEKDVLHNIVLEFGC